MDERIDYLRAERTNIARLLAAASQAPKRETNGVVNRTRGRVAVLEADLARLDQLIAEWEAAATRVL